MTTTHKKTLTISTRPSSSLTNQPVWVIISGDTDIGGRAQSDASDVRFYTPGGVELSWRKVAWTITAGSLDAVCMVVLPTVLSSADSEIEIHYGGGAATPAYSSTLSLSGLVGAWDMESTAPSDWSGAGNSLTPVGAPTATAGKIGTAVSLRSADTAYLQRTVANFRSTDSQGEVSCWLNIDAGGGRIFCSADTASIGYYLTATLTPTLFVLQRGAVTYFVVVNTALSLSTGWHHIAIQSNGTSWACLIDGSPITLTVAAGSNNGDWFADVANRDNFVVGALVRTTAGEFANSDIDDFRVYSSPRSGEAIGYQIAQTNSAGTWGAEEAIGGALNAADLTVAASIDSPALTQTHELTTADATVSTSIDSPSLTQTHALTAADVTVATSIDGPALTQTHALAIADATVATSIDSPSLTQTHQLTAADLTVATSIESPTLTGEGGLQPADVTVATSIDSPALTQTHSLTVADLASATSIDSPALTQTHQVTSGSLTCTVTIGSPTLTITHQLTADDLTVAATIASPTLSGTHQLSAEDLSVFSSIDSPTLILPSTVTDAHVSLSLSAETELVLTLAVDVDLVLVMDEKTTLTLALAGDPTG